MEDHRERFKDLSGVELQEALKKFRREQIIKTDMPPKQIIILKLPTRNLFSGRIIIYMSSVNG